MNGFLYRKVEGGEDRGGGGVKRWRDIRVDGRCGDGEVPCLMTQERIPHVPHTITIYYSILCHIVPL